MSSPPPPKELTRGEIAKEIVVLQNHIADTVETKGIDAVTEEKWDRLSELKDLLSTLTKED